MEDRKKKGIIASYAAVEEEDDYAEEEDEFSAQILAEERKRGTSPPRGEETQPSVPPRTPSGREKGFIIRKQNPRTPALRGSATHQRKTLGTIENNKGDEEEESLPTESATPDRKSHSQRKSAHAPDAGGNTPSVKNVAAKNTVKRPPSLGSSDGFKKTVGPISTRSDLFSTKDLGFAGPPLPMRKGKPLGKQLLHLNKPNMIGRQNDLLKELLHKDGPPEISTDEMARKTAQESVTKRSFSLNKTPVLPKRH